MELVFPERRESGALRGPVIFFFLLVAGLGYLVLTFVPPWYKTLSAKERIGEILSGMTAEGSDQEQVRERIADELNKIGVGVDVDDIELVINTNTRFADVTVVWKAKAKYPLTKKYREITFRIEVRRKMS